MIVEVEISTKLEPKSQWYITGEKTIEKYFCIIRFGDDGHQRGTSSAYRGWHGAKF